MRRLSVLLLALLGVSAGAQSSLVTSAASAAPGVTVQVYLSSTGLGLLALPKQVVASFAAPADPANLARPGAAVTQTVSGILGAVDGGAASTGWFMRGFLAAPSVVNLGALNLTWQTSSPSTTAPGADLLGVRLGVLNTTVPMTCDGLPHVVLQLDSMTGDYSARLSRIGAQSDVLAARVEYICRR